MDHTTLGSRIREARLAKKMTQSEVVGNFITRNMLSQIESGSATPSIKTLEYLSKVLEIPLSELMLPERDVLPPATATDLATQSYLELKEAFLHEDYETVSQKIVPYLEVTHLFYDECCAMYARCCFMQASASYNGGNYRSALVLAEQACSYAQLGCYANRDVRTQALLLLHRVSEEL